MHNSIPIDAWIYACSETIFINQKNAKLWICAKITGRREGGGELAWGGSSRNRSGVTVAVLKNLFNYYDIPESQCNLHGHLQPTLNLKLLF